MTSGKLKSKRMTRSAPIAVLACCLALCLRPAQLAAEEFEWSEAEASEVGIDPAMLVQLEDKARRGEYGRLKSLLVVRHGKLVHESYFNGYGPDDLLPLYSVTKSWASALVGIALIRGDLESVDQTLYSIFDQYSQLFSASPAKRSIRLRDVLTMRHGLAWDEWSTYFTNPANPVNQMTKSNDWWEFVLTRPMTAEIDSVFRYSTGTSNLLGGVIWSATGQSAIEYANAHLFNALDIDQYHIEVDLSGGPRGTGITDFQTGLTPTGHGLWLRARDLAKIGQLYLDRGVWRQQRVLPANWITQSWKSYSDSVSDPQVFPERVNYGFQWWGFEVQWNQGLLPVHMAEGFADQFIFVIPQLDLVVVSNADNGRYDGDDMADAIGDVIVAGVDSGFDPLDDGGLTGSWYSPDLQHQGFMLEIVPTTGQVVIYWMTFEPDTGKQQWMIAVGRLSGRRAILEFLRPVDGTFLGTVPASLETWGLGELEFHDCGQASLAYAYDNGEVQGVIDLRRLTPNTFCKDD